MFSNDPRDLTRTLGEMEKQARVTSNFNQVDAKEKLKEYLQHDRRFDQFNADALAKRVMECRSNGAFLDLDDPVLKGLERRPLDRSNW